MKIEYSLIAAISPDFIIGNGMKIPWHISEDFKLFKENTTNATIIMGKTTWDSLPIKPLPNRINIVISRNENLILEAAIITNSIENALIEAKKMNKPIFVIGGASIYNQTIKDAKYLYISHVKKKVEGDVFFPKFNILDYNIIEEKEYEEFIFKKYERKD